jgi:hypothetical protein
VHIAHRAFSYISVVRIANERPYGAGSGVLVHNSSKNSYVMTAGHICTPVSKKPNLKIQVVDKYGIVYESTIYKTKHTVKTDLCILKTKKRMPYLPVKIANRAPSWGDKVWNLNAGTSFFIPANKKGPGMIQIHEGYFSGYNPVMNSYVFTGISVWGGASGSMILNHRGQLVSIMVAYRAASLRHVREIGFGTSLPDIKKMLSSLIHFPGY